MVQRPKPLTRDGEKGRLSIIAAVTTPLNFFVLVVLVVEAGLGLFAKTLRENDQITLVLLIVGVLVLLILVVAFLAYVRPWVLTGVRTEYTVVIAPSAKLTGIDMTQISWNAEKCFLNSSGKKSPVVPVLGPLSPNFAIKIDPAILTEISGSKPLDMELVDKKGFRWEIRPFYIYQTSVEIFCLADAADVLDAYGDQQ
jgi:hypothetical protein